MDFRLVEVSENWDSFVESKYSELSDFNAFALRIIGDALRGPKSEIFWQDGAYCWFTDEKQSREQCVWMTTNGIAMFEDVHQRKLFRIIYER